MGRAFQPHESHIPYILQFLIDHNLYGMSQLFVPSELLLYRSKDGIADGTLKKLTSTANEVDLMSFHILNRLLLEQQTSSGYGNPGISSIWEDEKIRRGVDTISQLEPPHSQFRSYEFVTESDKFYRDMLKSRVEMRASQESDELERLEAMFLNASQSSSKKSTQDLEDLDGTIVDEEVASSLTPKFSETRKLLKLTIFLFKSSTKLQNVQNISFL